MHLAFFEQLCRNSCAVQSVRWVFCTGILHLDKRLPLSPSAILLAHFSQGEPCKQHAICWKHACEWLAFVLTAASCLLPRIFKPPSSQLQYLSASSL